MKVNLELDLDDVVAIRGYGDNERGVTLREAIVNAAARRVLEDVDAAAHAEISRRATEITDAAIRDQIEPIVRDTIQSRIVPRLGAKEKSLHEHIADIVREELKGRTDSRAGYRTQESILVRLLREEVERTFRAELKGDLDAAKDEVRAAVREKGAELLAETISRMAER